MEDSIRFTTRREFAKKAAAAAAIPLLASIPACAHPAPPAPAPAHEPATPAAPPAPSGATAPPAGNTRPPDPTAVALTQVLREKYGSRLTEEQWAEVQQGVQGNLASAKALHDFAIPMATEPPCGFRPYRGGDR